MKSKDNRKEKVKIIPLGGLEQIGMNITAFEYRDSIVVVDCGMAFPEDDMLGIDIVLPDITYLEENYSKIKGFVITHGHEDHIGAIPYVFRKINVPIYTTKLTMALIENKLEEHEMLDLVRREVVNYGQFVELGDISVEFIKTNHSIQDAAALALHTPAGVIVHTGDFKVDYTPVFGDAIDLQRFAELGKNGVLALMCDSTNAERPGYTMSERTVGEKFEKIFAEYANSRLIIATFASNVDRVQQIINCAARFGRKVCLEGRSMINVIGTAIRLGYIEDSSHTIVDLDTILAESDVITLHMPLLEDTKGIINKENVRKMKDGVVLINNARGELCDVDALIEGVETEKIGALFMDAFPGEVGIIHIGHDADIIRTAGMPYFKLKYLRSFVNVYHTPHMAFFTQEAGESMARCGVDAIYELMTKGETQHEVPKNI